MICRHPHSAWVHRHWHLRGDVTHRYCRLECTRCGYVIDEGPTK